MKRLINLLVGPALFVLCLFVLPQSVFTTLQARAAIGTLAWTAYWWITGPIDFAMTGILPIVVNAFIEMAPMNSVLANYSSETILLLFATSVLTACWEDIGLDRRIATRFLSLIGGGMRVQIVFWFILCTVLSAVLPNAVVCAAITPIAVSMLKYAGEGDIQTSRKGSLILLAIVYATGVGGLASPLGGAMNLVTVDYLQQLTGQEYMYISWFLRFLPIMLVLVVSNIALLFVYTKKDDALGGTREYFIAEYKKLPGMTKEEILSLGLFLLATLLAFTRSLYQDLLPGLKPAYVFALCAVVSFLIRKKDGSRLMIWKETSKKVVWELIFVFAGGLALGTLVNSSGAADMIGALVAKTNMDGGIVTVFIIVAMTMLLSDVTSNTATAAIAIPIVISIVQGIGKNPIPYVYIASIGVNLSYMLPTSIRAIPVGYGLHPQFMLKKGILFEVGMIILMTVVGYLLMQYWPAFGTV